MDQKLRPIIKWTGGKYHEFALFAEKIPAFERYIEPFFGGGGVFFALQPKGEAIINDKSTDLTNFYKSLTNPQLQKELLKYALAWKELGDLYAEVWKHCKAYFIDYIKSSTNLVTLAELVGHYLSLSLRNSTILNDVDFVIDQKSFEAKLLASVIDKSKRIQKICTKEKRTFNTIELANHFETGIKSGAYLFFRSMLNQNFSLSSKLEPAKAIANWYFVREFCYGSMFRFNSKGEFNIPYGGITYNKKNFLQKVENIFNPAIISLFANTKVANQDFEDFLKGIMLCANDFIFLDPPYDSEFSEYDQSSFTQQDQLRLANFLADVPAKWMVVIKETPFIRALYEKPHIHIHTFYKNYAYNIRGRNDRKVQHLIITNY